MGLLAASPSAWGRMCSTRWRAPAGVYPSPRASRGRARRRRGRGAAPAPRRAGGGAHHPVRVQRRLHARAAGGRPRARGERRALLLVLVRRRARAGALRLRPPRPPLRGLPRPRHPAGRLRRGHPDVGPGRMRDPAAPLPVPPGRDAAAALARAVPRYCAQRYPRALRPGGVERAANLVALLEAARRPRALRPAPEGRVRRRQAGRSRPPRSGGRAVPVRGGEGRHGRRRLPGPACTGREPRGLRRPQRARLPHRPAGDRERPRQARPACVGFGNVTAIAARRSGSPRPGSRPPPGAPAAIRG